MRTYRRCVVTLASLGLALSMAGQAWAGRIHRDADTAFEITRIVSQFQGGTSETVAAAETNPIAPIAGQTTFLGWAHRFPEFGQVWTWRSVEGWRRLDPSSFSFKAELAAPTAAVGNVWSVVFQFNANQVRLIQNAYVFFQIQPQPPGPFGDNIEAFWLRAPGF